jgi:hypothetical protein
MPEKQPTETPSREPVPTIPPPPDEHVPHYAPPPNERPVPEFVPTDPTPINPKPADPAFLRRE